MKIIEPTVELLTPINGAEVLKLIESCGRVCYRSEKNITADSAPNFVRMLIKRGHESVLEHYSCTFKIVCDRGVMAEMTRHRLASFSVESSRYVDYSKELVFVKPPYFEEEYNVKWHLWEHNAAQAEYVYKTMREKGAPPEEARAVLPMSLATTMIMTANLREWRHVLKLRTSSKAHPQMRQVAGLILNIFREKLPVVFEDIGDD